MSRKPLHALTWSQNLSLYEFSASGSLMRQFSPKDEEAWLAWLVEEKSFSFQGISGSLNVYKESRPRGGGYWYAYHTTPDRTHKRYLGRDANLTFARLEEVAKALNGELVPSSLAHELARGGRDIAWNAVLPTASSREVMSGMELLSTRMAHPLLPSSLVIRERLLTRLDAALSYRLTLLSASAGWGKTTLLAAWAARSPFPLAWLSLDELDNEPTHFWVSMLVALRACLPGTGETTLTMLRSPQLLPLTVILSTLLHELNALTQPLFLLVDDYHLIEDQTIHDSLLFLLEHLPAHLHLVLASRIDPPLALARWRVRGQLLELREADLRFHEEEAMHFFTQGMSLTLSTEDVAQLTQRTEGWVAGLQLAALSMQHREDLTAFVQSFTGSHRHVLDYVQEEILARLPVELQHFLFQIAILNKISAPLCQAITGENESQMRLEQVERANLFLVPLDEERCWYRMHDLFREALLTRLHATQPALIPILHQRAVRFYEGQREFREAIPHALAAEDFWSAARLMEQALEAIWLSGESQTLALWVMALPLAVVRKHARFALSATLYMLNSAASTEVARLAPARVQGERIMGRVEEAVFWGHTTQEAAQEDERLPVTELSLLRQRLLLLRLWSETMRENVIDNIEGYRRAVEHIQQLDLEDDIIWQMIPLSMTFIFRWSFQGEGTSLMPIGCTLDGMLTEYALLDEDALVHIPAYLTFEEAATLPCAALTAWSALTGPDPIRPGDTVLTLGTGGVALFALQLAKALGAHVIATTSSDEKAERLKHLGADDIVNYRTTPDWSRTVRELTNGKGVARVVDTGGSDTLEESIKSVAPNGEIALVTAIGKRPMIEIHPPVLAASLLTIRRFLVGNRAAFEDMLHTIASSELHPVIDRSFAFADARQAYQYYATGHIFGKVVIRGA